jgi:protocatechuate 3,4-dioxygenase beta subunit
MEPRQLLAADPLQIGAVYVEEDAGTDAHGDSFYLTFEGGAPGTQLTRVTIDCDQNAPGFGVGDLFFDTALGGRGADQAQGYSLIALSARDPNARVTASVSDGGSLLTLDLTGFQAGDRLVFSIDVDEVQQYDPDEKDPDVMNEGFDPITSGVEFQGSQITAYFSADHYHDISGVGEFRNRYDELLAGRGLDLPADNEGGKRDRSTGTGFSLTQQPLPVSIAGTVYLETNLDLVQDAPEPGIANVELGLWRKQDGQYVFTGHTTRTAADGSYEFGLDLNLLPGTYQVREVQPAGLFSVGAVPGTVAGSPVGLTAGSPDVLTEITIPLGDQHAVDYDFAEAEPARISGHVYHDRNNNGVRDAGEEGLAGVTVQVVPVDAIATQALVTIATNGEGFYAATGLAPGTYRVVQPAQPAGYFDGLDAAGTVAGLTVGSAVNPGDRIVDIRLGGGQAGIHYDFGEIAPASIQGQVCLSDTDGLCFTPDAEHPPIAGAVVLLLDAQGKTLRQTTTDAQGRYEFTGLMPGTYKVREITPPELKDGGENVGTVNGQVVGSIETNDLITGIVLGAGQNGVHYDFCEHPPAALSGFVYHDANNNGVRDAGETPIADVEVALVLASGTQVATTRTAADGSYQFTGLDAGQYSVRESQPSGWRDGLDAAGTIAGAPVGTAQNPGDLLTAITLGWGRRGIEYNFGELLPASLTGRVHEDLSRNCTFDADEKPIGGVVVELLNAEGVVLATTRTDALGRYRFDDLAPGMYAVRETQPPGYFQGGQRVGSHGGDASQRDLIRLIPIGSGQHLTDYDFCEVPPGSIAGTVHIDLNNDCEQDANEAGIGGVRVDLVNEQGRIVASATTASDGSYRFDNLEPGVYAVHETQPEHYFHGGQCIGTGDGDASTPDWIRRIKLPGGVHLVQYDFPEVPPAELSGYVFQDGPVIQTRDGRAPENIAAIRDGLRTPDDRPLPGVVLELRDGLTGEAIPSSEALPGLYGTEFIQITTDSNGFYRFAGIRGNASYSVYEVHPSSYVDSLDTPGTTLGIAINPSSPVDPSVLAQLVTNPKNDAIIRIPLRIGEASQNNNFSEVLVATTPPPVPPFDPPVNPPGYLPPLAAPPQLPPTMPAPGYVGLTPPIAGGGAGPALGSAATWHLSIIDAGMPRDVASAEDVDPTLWTVATYLEFTNWDSDRLSAGRWLLPASGQSGSDEDALRQILFGIYDAIPVTGDFNGDGVTEVGVFYHGEWFIDLNGNGRWDQEDLWARLGSDSDLPVVGDWDGDGKDDIGIFGPEWAEDARAIRAEPGLPDSFNTPKQKPKNVPPRPSEATDGRRLLRLSVSGPRRADVIDHVFRFGGEQDQPVAGDWNGDGIRTVGVFQGGRWRLDSDGDGRLTTKDVRINYGVLGDVPIVGDFNGDGVEEIGVYRSGTWFADVNGDHVLDAHDRVFSLGTADDRPVVGDWNGDGVDEPGVYQNVSGAASPPAQGPAPAENS